MLATHLAEWQQLPTKKGTFALLCLFFFSKKICFFLGKFSTVSLAALEGEKSKPAPEKKIIFTLSHDKSPCAKVKLFPGEN